MDETVTNTLDRNKAHSQASKNLLIIGGTSSIAEYIGRFAINEGYNLYSTFKNSEKKHNNIQTEWIYLNFNDFESVEQSLAYLKDIEFDKIIYLVGQLSDLQNTQSAISQFEEYFKSNVTLPVWFLKTLVFDKSFGSSCTFTYLSSRAADAGSNDYCYGVAKAAIENLFKSLSLMYKPNLHFQILVSGLIMKSNMQKKMPRYVVERHQKMSNSKLLTTEEAAVEIWTAINTQSKKSNLSKLSIGPKY